MVRGLRFLDDATQLRAAIIGNSSAGLRELRAIAAAAISDRENPALLNLAFRE
jgi:hypothetical protein